MIRKSHATLADRPVNSSTDPHKRSSVTVVHRSKKSIYFSTLQPWPELDKTRARDGHKWIGIMQIWGELQSKTGRVMNAKKSMMNLYCRTGQQLNEEMTDSRSCLWTLLCIVHSSDACPDRSPVSEIMQRPHRVTRQHDSHIFRRKQKTIPILLSAVAGHGNKNNNMNIPFIYSTLFNKNLQIGFNKDHFLLLCFSPHL